MRAALASALLVCLFCIPALSADANDEAALQELLRGPDGVMKHWTHAPALVVLDSVMLYHDGAVGSYTATAERLTDEEAADLVTDLTEALRVLTGSAYVSFASVRRES